MFLANENFPRPSILKLREQGYAVTSVQESFRGISDEEVVSIALASNLIILTFDKDYGELIFRYGSRGNPSVIFFRFKGINPLFAGNFLVNTLAEKIIDFNNAFTVIEENNIRQRHYKK